MSFVQQRKIQDKDYPKSWVTCKKKKKQQHKNSTGQVCKGEKLGDVKGEIPVTERGAARLSMRDEGLRFFKGLSKKERPIFGP
jgi:hypothetical protein